VQHFYTSRFLHKCSLRVTRFRRETSHQFEKRIGALKIEGGYLFVVPER